MDKVLLLIAILVGLFVGLTVLTNTRYKNTTFYKMTGMPYKKVTRNPKLLQLYLTFQKLKKYEIDDMKHAA